MPKDINNPKLAHEYIEKIVQIPIPVPQATHEGLVQYVRNLMDIDEAKEREQIIPPSPEPPPIVPEPVQSTILNRPFANSMDPLKPLQLQDTPTERKAITNFAATFLDGNPRRIKRLLNTYRYVKTLATRIGEETDNEKWQAKMVNWLGLTMRWPTFMQEVLNQVEERTDFVSDEASLKNVREELSEIHRPPEKILPFVSHTYDLKRFSIIANNFLVENRTAAQQYSNDASNNKKEETLLVQKQNLEAIEIIRTLLENDINDETKQKAIQMLEQLADEPEN